jgi:8-oxo-dGTP pyrophosphatase MutT (NUDIX family)
MTDLSGRIADEHSDKRFTHMRPRDAATLIVIDRSEPVFKVLMGRRHQGHKFMPGKFVFPGGRVEPYDGRMPAMGEIPEQVQSRLLLGLKRKSATRARALALAAVRETCEETGLLLGRRHEAAIKAPHVAWEAFSKAGVLPELANLHYIARAITPPLRPRRFDTRFFAADASSIAERLDGIIGPDAELTEMVWVPFTDARALDLPSITHMVLDELEIRIRDGFGRDLPVPLFRMVHGRFVRSVF